MLTIDAHSDLLMDIVHRRSLDETAVLENRWIPRMRQGGIDFRIAAIYIDNDDVPEQALRKGLDMAATLHREVEESPSAALCLDSADIRAAKEAGQVGFMLSMEGAEPLGSDPLLLKAFHLLGLRLLGLTHSRRNLAADGSRFLGTPPGRPGGVSDIGASFIELAQELKIILDLSHLNDESFWDVVELTKGPLIASHSNSREVWDIGRNLTDPMIKAVADRGGGDRDQRRPVDRRAGSQPGGSADPPGPALSSRRPGSGRPGAGFLRLPGPPDQRGGVETTPGRGGLPGQGPGGRRTDRRAARPSGQTGLLGR